MSAEVLKERCTDITQGNWFYLPDGTPDPFWKALKERCGAYMKEHNVSRDMKWSTFLFDVFLLAIQPAIWWFGYCNAYPWYSHAAALVMAVTWWWAGRLGHDGGHFAVSRKYWVNRVVGNWAGLGLSNISYWEILVRPSGGRSVGLALLSVCMYGPPLPDLPPFATTAQRGPPHRHQHGQGPRPVPLPVVPP